MEMEDLRNLTEQELSSRTEDLQNELFNLRLQSSTGKLESPMKLRQLRRNIARVKTVARGKEIEKKAS